MSEAQSEAALEREFDALAERAGLAIPPERRAILFQGFKDLRGMTGLLRRPRTAAAEPAGTYAIETVVRSL